ncbi:3-oxoacyl-(acyl-carrier-protein) reductase FabG [Cupriavidus taiwanensis]|uniref:SDR family NAD(P)-dependent oxidoreductase n=1 Tax=Cupriavidus taiwanensis TaxID=164546 RepID=UPI000E139217|nr:SDR family NAD(P)-dependent oxidoreductase [Cupriavidus taiwanensis]SPA02269.1 3-oxoacyl-(acyl-carrier-protein) reductase FabG [Cupriavidus taiwanensis]
MKFYSKTVLITGAGGNLGYAVASAFAEEGAKLVLFDRNPSKLGEFEGSHMVCGVDLVNQSDVSENVRAAVERFGQIDVVCNLAGGFSMGSPVHESSEDDIEHLLDLNVRTLLNVVRAVAPSMIGNGGGRFINVGANSAAKGVGLMSGYCATKDMVARITESMSAELRDSNINVNAVLPSIIDTPENRSAMPDADHDRWVKPRALADVIQFLASDAARAIHGALIPVTNRS